MEQGPTEKGIFERHVRYGMPLPDSVINAPELYMGLEFYFNAFRHLSTCRVNGMGLGNITYFMCIDYCNENDIQDEQREDFIVVILELDEFFIEKVNEKSKKKSKKKPNQEVEKETEE